MICTGSYLKLALKKEGALCHSSVPFLKILQVQALMNNELDYNWNCADDRERFPSWVTIDCDGMVFPCDDFQPRDIIPNMKINYLTKGYNWNIFKKFWLRKVKKECPGCLWNTHIDAHFIKAGNIPFSDYVHTKE